MQEELQITKRRRQQPVRVSYFVLQDGEQMGPMTLAQLQGFYRSGHVKECALYWQEGMQEWMPLDHIKERLALTRKSSAEARDAKLLRLRERTERKRKEAFKQTMIFVVFLLLLMAAVAVIFFFLGQVV